MELILNEIIQDIHNQFESYKNGYGEPQAWITLEHNNRSIEITHEKAGLSEDEEYYSLRLHCNEDEYDSDKFHKTMGIIDVYNTAKISSERLHNGLQYLIEVNQRII